MTISQTAEYALRAIVWLASQPDWSCRTSGIACATGVPSGYLSKVLQGLSRSGLVASRQGRTGGFALSRPAAEISVLDVINATDPIKRIRLCPLGDQRHQDNLCPLHRHLDAAIALLEKAFAETSIAQLVQESRIGGPLCENLAVGRKRTEAASSPSDESGQAGRKGSRPRPRPGRAVGGRRNRETTTSDKKGAAP